MSVELYGDWNVVVYTGKAQSSLDALASLVPCGLLAGVWYWNNETHLYELMQTPGLPPYDRDIMVPYGVYQIRISQDCVWTYGEDDIPLSSVQLYSNLYYIDSDEVHDWNIVPYCGPSQSAKDAFALLSAIMSFPFPVVICFNNVTKVWEDVLSDTIMIPNTPYYIAVNQNCLWSFVVVPTQPTVSEFKILDYIKV